MLSLSQMTAGSLSQKTLCGRVNSWVWGIMVFFCFVLLDLMHRKLPRTSNNYSKTTLLPSRGHSRQAGAQRHCKVSVVTIRWEKAGAQNWEFQTEPQAQRGIWQRWGKPPPPRSSLTSFIWKYHLIKHLIKRPLRHVIKGGGKQVLRQFVHWVPFVSGKNATRQTVYCLDDHTLSANCLRGGGQILERCWLNPYFLEVFTILW